MRTRLSGADSHLSDADLIRLADGELGSGSARSVLGHLEACWQCRARLRELEGAISEFVRLREEAFAPAIPAAGARAMLRARLSEEARTTTPGRFHISIPALATGLLVLVAMLVTFGGTVNADGPKPRLSITPGETRPVSLAEVCASSADSAADPIPESVRLQVFAAYGMDPAQADAYEVDYLITPELGGAYTVRNLWPQPYSARWNARVKDRLEHRLHQLVCSGQLDLHAAQRDISTDWIGAYRKYVGPGI